MKCVTDFGVYDVDVSVESYACNDNLAIVLNELTTGPFATLTVNLYDDLPEDMAFVDINNYPWAEEFIKENNLGEPTGKYGKSGFCVYPLYRFYLDKIEGDERCEE